MTFKEIYFLKKNLILYKSLGIHYYRSFPIRYNCSHNTSMGGVYYLTNIRAHKCPQNL